MANLPINREQAIELLKKYNKDSSDFNHFFETEAIMGALAKKLGEDEEYWRMLGLLHDIDWGLTKHDLKEHLTKAPEGIKEYVSFQRIYYDSQPQNPTEFASMILKMRELGTDGWIIWHYGGPGDHSDAPDIRDYLELIPMPDVFAMGNIQVQPDGTEATVTWLTSSPASSKGEFSDSPLFTYMWTLWSDTRYWKPSYNPGTIIEDPAPKTIHSITLTGLTPLTKYYFRVQSKGSSSVITRKVLTFTTGS